MISVPKALSKSALRKLAKEAIAEVEKLSARVEKLEKNKTKNKKEEVK